MREPSAGGPPSDDLTTAAGELLGVLNRMPRHMAPSLARDLTFGQIRLLFLLRLEGPQPMGRIADVFELSLAAATGFVGRVERHDLVARRHRSDDRRVVECALTATGARFLDELSGVRMEGVRSLLAVLTPSELSEFRVLLGRIRERTEEPA